MKIFMIFSLLCAATSIHAMDKKNGFARTITVNNLEELITKRQMLSKGTRVFCAGQTMDEPYIVENERTSHLARYVTISRSHRKCCGETIQKVTTTFMKPLNNTANQGEVHTSRELKCGTVSVIASLTVKIALWGALITTAAFGWTSQS